MSLEEDLLRRIRLGEDSALELKQVFFAGSKIKDPSRDDLADELAAFANGRGGLLILGVADRSHEPVGIPVERLDDCETWVRQICNDSIKPSLDASIRKVELSNSSGQPVPVILIEVERSLFVHESPGGYFRRIGSSKRKLPPDSLARLMQERSQTRVIRFDESPVPGTTIADLDEELARRFVRETIEPMPLQLEKLRLLVDDEGTQRLSVAGVLMCARDPQRWLRHAEIQAVAYAGERKDKNYQLDARDFGGRLDDQVFEALHFVRRNMAVRAAKELMRTEKPAFSEKAVFEALVNAVAHRDYTMAGSRVRLHMFANRLELFVPGALPNTLNVESMRLRQYSRNELIVSLLARTPMRDDATVGRAFIMDRRGDGVPIIYDECELLSGTSPKYEVLDDSELRLTIYAAALVDS